MFDAHQHTDALFAVRDELNTQFPTVLRQKFFGALVFRPGEATFENGLAIRAYIRERTDLHAEWIGMTAEQAAWRTYFQAVSIALAEAAPNVLSEIELREVNAFFTPAWDDVLTKVESSYGTFNSAWAVGEYAAAKAALHLAQPTSEQVAWRVVHERLMAMLRQRAPGLMAELEPRQQTIRSAQLLKLELEKLAASGKDKGFRVSIGFTIFALLAAALNPYWFPAMPIYGALGAISGFFFSIFVVKSPGVQMQCGLKLRDMGLLALGSWLYDRGFAAMMAQNRRNDFTDDPNFGVKRREYYPAEHPR